MNIKEIKCPKCQSNMFEGWIIDYSSGITQSRWIPGKPEKSFLHGFKPKKKQQHPIEAFRCEKCGYLELYAQSIDIQEK